MGTIKSTREIDRIFRSSRRVTTPLITVLIAQTPEGRGPRGRVAFVAGKKLGGAVVRNRAKRVMRAAVRRVDGPWDGLDIVLIARPGIGDAPAHDLDRSFAKLIERLGADR